MIDSAVNLKNISSILNLLHNKNIHFPNCMNYLHADWATMLLISLSELRFAHYN